MFHTLRRFFGLSPKVGDKVKGYIDYGVQFDGVVTEDHSKSGFPTYTVKGRTFFNREWSNEFVEKFDNNIIVSANRVRLA